MDQHFKRIIGVDIDGVLNKHVEQFVNIYNKLYCNQDGKAELKASSITTLPVSKSGIISREDEQEVFKRCNTGIPCLKMMNVIFI